MNALRQTGAALLAAMLTLTLVASLAAGALWQQWRWIEVESAERTRSQAGWILIGALDWARLILREDARAGGADHLAEPWAVTLQEARLSSFLAADKNNTALTSEEDPLELFLAGQIEDMQGRLNLSNLADNGTLSEPALLAFGKLFELLNLPPRELQTLAENMRFASDTSANNRSAALAALPMQRADDVLRMGLTSQTWSRLRPFVALLPVRTPININTASAQVLYASIPTLEMDAAQRLVAQRQRQHFRSLSEAGQFMPDIAFQVVDAQHAVATRYFEVRGRLRMAGMVVQERSLVVRDGLEVKTLWRERASLQ